LITLLLCPCHKIAGIARRRDQVTTCQVSSAAEQAGIRLKARVGLKMQHMHMLLTSILDAQLIIASKLIVTLSALGVKGSRRDGFAEAEFSLSRMFTSRGFKKPARLLVRGVELSTADMRAAFALRLTTDGLRLRRSTELDAFLADLGTAPDSVGLQRVQQGE